MRGFFAMAISGILVCVLTGCTSNGARESSSGSYMTGVSAMHSEMNMRLKLMLTSSGESCSGKECRARYEFEKRVTRIGDRLSQTAMSRYPELKNRFPYFRFAVVDTMETGVTSSDAGSIVVMRGVDRLGLDDAALAFVMAREMAHVIVGHHEDNTMTSLAISVVAQIVMPMLNVARGAAAAVAGNAAATSAVTSVAAMAGSKAAVSSQRPEQLHEAEAVGMELMAVAGFSVTKAAASLHARVGNTRFQVRSEDDWMEELRASLPRVEKLVLAQGGNAGAPIRLASIGRDISQAQTRIEAGADPSKVTEASAARARTETVPDDYLTELAPAVAPAPEPSRRSALRAKRAELAAKGGHWGLGGYSEKAKERPVAAAAATAATTGEAAVTDAAVAAGHRSATNGHWSPWGYSERTQTEAGEEGSIIKTVSADQAKSAATAEKFVRIPSASPKKDRLVPQGYWGTWGYGP
jgi:hypothetical protein